MFDALAIPDAATSADSGVELMRLWTAAGRLHTSLRIGYWEDYDIVVGEPEAWGVVLADTIRHIANAHLQAYGRDHSETVARIHKALTSELRHPSSAHPGQFATSADDP
jgi:hypothetical protein